MDNHIRFINNQINLYGLKKIKFFFQHEKFILKIKNYKEILLKNQRIITLTKSTYQNNNNHNGSG